MIPKLTPCRSSPVAEFGKGAVELPVEHGLVADEAVERLVGGQGGQKRAAGISQGILLLGIFGQALILANRCFCPGEAVLGLTCGRAGGMAHAYVAMLRSLDQVAKVLRAWGN